MVQKRLALISCFFGKLPWYFDYFSHSCRYNDTVDFIIITDDLLYNKQLPSNIKMLHSSLEEISNLISFKLQFDVNISYGYKMCDFKPAYGVIFADFLRGYDFWGHIDIDLIFGDIRSFMTDELMAQYDIISVRPDWITGCFLLYSNNDVVNNLFRQSHDYQKVFTDSKHYCFDETNFAHDEFSKGILYSEIDTEIESMMHVVSRLQSQGRLRVYYDLHIIEGIPGHLRWDNGKMYYRCKYEVMCYHMIHFKNSCRPLLNISTMPERFKVSPTKIYHEV